MQFIGHAGYGIDHLVANGANEPGGSTPLLLDDRRSNRHHGLTKVVLTHLAIATRKHVRDSIGNYLVQPQLHTHNFGDGLARDVVVGGPQPTAHDDGIGIAQYRSQRSHDPRLVVAHLHLQTRVEPGSCELLAQPRGIGVDYLPEQQLGADGNDVTAH